MSRIRIGIVGVGNCASSLVQGIHYYRAKGPGAGIGLMHWEVGTYRPGDIEVVAAFDIDKRKVGRDVNEAIFSEPNCAVVFCSDLPRSGVGVRMGKVLDGVSPHMKEYDEGQTFIVSEEEESTGRGGHRGPSGHGGRGIDELFTGRIRGGDGVLCGLCAGGGGRFNQQHTGIYCE